MGRRSRAREVALQLLFQREHNPGVGRADMERFAFDRLGDAELHRFCMALVDGVAQHQPTIDDKLSAAAENWRLSRMATVDRNLLRLGAFEMLLFKETPSAVVLDEVIELARRFGSADSPAFVNGVLDRLRRDAAATAGAGSSAPGADVPDVPVPDAPALPASGDATLGE